MRILVHDYAGHPFQVQLSRGLAARGHQVLHCYCGATHTPRGELSRRDDDPETFKVRCIDLPTTIAKYKFIKRFQMETEYGRRLVRVCDNFLPDVILSGNTPSIPQNRLARFCQQRGIRLVSWIQDMYGLAAYRIVSKRIPVVGHLAGKYFIWLDRQSARMSDQVVVISEDFAPEFVASGVDEHRIHTVHNWAPLDRLHVTPKRNAWAQEQHLEDTFRFVYSGTLSIRHNPDLLLQLGKQLDARGEGELIVVSEGDGIDWLREQAKAEDIRRIRFLGFQPFERLNEVFGAADALVAILEPDAGIFCVPSKVLSYLCSARPVLAAIPITNLAARLVKQHGLGLTADPRNVTAFLDAADALQNDTATCQSLGRNARAYAEKHFDFNKICDRFQNILGGDMESAVETGGARPHITSHSYSSSPRSLASTE
jgi:colanic acid biosynthesis glycosyl transferase WcaI